MIELFLDALTDSAKLLPFLFLVYFVTEWLEYKYGAEILHKIAHAKKIGPVFGAFFGSVPQCGFSVVGTALYTRRLVTTGTLIAIYISTSDEAIPILLTHPKQIFWIIPLLITKIVIAIVAGTVIDLISKMSSLRATNGSEAIQWIAASPPKADPCDDKIGFPEGCCSHLVLNEKKKSELFLHPLRHTLIVFVFLLITSLLINLIVNKVGTENLGTALMKGSFFQPAITAFIGLIPNCAASVAITQAFLKGCIGYGSLISGLSASAGMGLLVLIKENKSVTDTLRVLGLLLLISISSGILVQLLFG